MLMFVYKWKKYYKEQFWETKYELLELDKNLLLYAQFKKQASNTLVDTNIYSLDNLLDDDKNFYLRYRDEMWLNWTYKDYYNLICYNLPNKLIIDWKKQLYIWYLFTYYYLNFFYKSNASIKEIQLIDLLNLIKNNYKKWFTCDYSSQYFDLFIKNLWNKNINIDKDIKNLKVKINANNIDDAPQESPEAILPMIDKIVNVIAGYKNYKTFKSLFLKQNIFWINNNSWFFQSRMTILVRKPKYRNPKKATYLYIIYTNESFLVCKYIKNKNIFSCRTYPEDKLVKGLKAVSKYYDILINKMPVVLFN